MSKLKMIMLFLLLGFNITQSFSWNGMPTPALHVEGRFLKDPNGNNVVLRGGWMQPTETWFNGGGRWYSNPSDWTNTNNVAGMLNFLKDAATLMSDPSPKYGSTHGWYSTFVRVNTDAVGGWTQEAGLVNQAQFNGWIQNFLVPYANHLRSRGLYLVLCATGPMNTPNNGSHNAGMTERERLRTFWSTVANASGVKNADNIMFELMNEPVDIESSPGNGDWGHGQAKYFQAFRNWIQPVINDIRSTGANNIVWVPTLEWQGSPREHVQYPFTGTNCGVAVHYYPAYGGCNDNVSCHNNLWNTNYKPAADIWPMIITENFWFPEDNGLDAGSTANYGNTLHANITAEGNVSYMVGFLSDLLDDLTKASPANCNLSLKQGAQAAFEWFYQDNNKSCTPTSITPYVKVNNGAWTSSSAITVNVGDTLTIGPQPVSGGSWSWTGPNSFSSNIREIVLANIQSNRAGVYTATYTNTGGCKSTATFIVTVNTPCTPTTIIPYVNINGGTWANSSSATVTAGGSVTFGPQPLTGGTWSWSGPNVFSASTRELLLSNLQLNQSGNYVATYTNAAGCKSSNTFTLTISIPNAAPTVSISSPVSGTTFTAPANITITANASDADGTIANVQFYQGTTLLGSDATSPYSFTFSNIAAGTYSLTAKATDNAGAVTTSTAITVIVVPNAAPTVSISSPVSGTTFTAPANITITANASDADGTIANVQFYQGTTLLGSDATAPYSFTFGNVVAGTYDLTTRATDNMGAVTISTAVTITVNACTPTAITPYTKINSGPWAQVPSGTLDAGGSVTLGPQPLYVGSWSWTGPNGFTASTREILLSTIQASQAGNYVATYTNTSGCKSTQTFSVMVTVPSTTIQCETACSVDGTLNETFNAGFHGTGYVNTDNFLGASATWSVNSQTAQTVTLGIRYAHTTAAGRPMSLSVNGVTQISNISFGPTASNTTWVVTSVQITLAAGTNTIKFVSTSAQGSPYLDEFIFGSKVVQGTCPAPALAAAAMPSIASPNPSSGAFTIYASEEVSSVKVSDMNGIGVYTHGGIMAGETIQFGENLTQGLYVVSVLYTSGRVEMKKIQKI